MSRFLLRRLMYSAVAIVAVSLVVFGSMHASGDPALLIAGVYARPQDVEAVREQLGLDRPLYVQYLSYLGNALRGDFGQSLHYRTSVFRLITEHWLRTLPLVVVSLVIATLIAIPLGMLAAVYRGTLADNVVLWIALVGQATPVFLLAILLIWVFAVQHHWLPVLTSSLSLRDFTLPVVTLAAFSLALLARLVRSSMLEVLGEDYIRTARAKGLRRLTVVRKHAFRNAATGIVALLGLQVGYLLSGVVVVESIFAWPGLGKLMYDAILARDYPLILGGSLFIAVMISMINFFVDLSYGFLDPRIRYG